MEQSFLTNNYDRQLAVEYQQVEQSHRARYVWAFHRAVALGVKSILDCACGIGYGTWLFAQGGMQAVGVDIEPDCKEWAEQHFAHDNAAYYTGDGQLGQWPDLPYEAILSFETIEHVPAPASLLKNFYDTGANYLFCSSPNGDNWPYEPEKWTRHKYPHLRHSTEAEFTALLEACGWHIQAKHHNLAKKPGHVLTVFATRM